MVFVMQVCDGQVLNLEQYFHACLVIFSVADLFLQLATRSTKLAQTRCEHVSSDVAGLSQEGQSCRAVCTSAVVVRGPTVGNDRRATPRHPEFSRDQFAAQCDASPNSWV